MNLSLALRTGGVQRSLPRTDPRRPTLRTALRHGEEASITDSRQELLCLLLADSGNAPSPLMPYASRGMSGMTGGSLRRRAVRLPERVPAGSLP
jgi:hypothetical protein